jgi:hypothetical protein
MEARESMTLLDGFEGSVQQMKLKPSFARNVTARCTINADPGEIDRGCLGHPREPVRGLQQIIGVRVLLLILRNAWKRIGREV